MTPPAEQAAATSAKPSAFVSPAEILATTFVRHVEVYDTLDSTNNRALVIAGDTTFKRPAAIIARQQTAGRGRGTNPWWSSDGALTFSILLEPLDHGIAVERWPQLSLATAVAVCDALGPLIASNPNQIAGAAIKWPNDVLVDGRKIAGILIESPGGVAPTKDQLVVGIGININNSCPPLPPKLLGADGRGANRGSATALRDVTGRAYELQAMLVDFLRAFERRIGELAAGDPLLAEAWQQLCWLTGQKISVANGGQVISGICRGISVDGALVVATAEGSQHLHSGSVVAVGRDA